MIRYEYVGTVALHEFGHTLGLHDFYDDKTMVDLPSVMGKPDYDNLRNIWIEHHDLEQLRAIYLLHSPHKIK